MVFCAINLVQLAKFPDRRPIIHIILALPIILKIYARIIGQALTMGHSLTAHITEHACNHKGLSCTTRKPVNAGKPVNAVKVQPIKHFCMHPLAMETAATLVHSLHCTPKWPPWRLPSCCYAVTSYVNILLTHH